MESSNLEAYKFECNDEWKYAKVKFDGIHVHGNEHLLFKDDIINTDNYVSYTVPNYLVCIGRVSISPYPSVIIYSLKESKPIRIFEISGNKTFSEIMNILFSDEANDITEEVAKKAAINFMPYHKLTYTGKNVPYTWTNDSLTYGILKSSNISTQIDVKMKDGSLIFQFISNEPCGISLDVDNGVILAVNKDASDKQHTTLVKFDNHTGKYTVLTRPTVSLPYRLYLDASTLTAWKGDTQEYVIYKLKDDPLFSERYEAHNEMKIRLNAIMGPTKRNIVAPVKRAYIDKGTGYAEIGNSSRYTSLDD